MFDPTQQFYPTPDHVALRMWNKASEFFRFDLDEVFDPSAGKGDLLNNPKGISARRNLKTYAVEIDLNLQTILREKHKVIGGDFLTFDEDIDFQCILMNPPFNDGDRHALKAWNFVRPKGVIVGLLNLQTLANPSTKERQRLLSLIEEFGGWEDLGSCFSEAERKTDVQVAMFWMFKPAKIVDPKEFKFSGNFKEATPEVFEEFATNPLTSIDAIDSLIAQYKVMSGLIRTRFEVQSELNYFMKTLPGRRTPSSKIVLALDPNDEIQTLKSEMWHRVFELTRINEVTTSDFQKKLAEFVRDQVKMEFCKANILEALAMFFQNKEQIIIDSICSVFDRATAYHENNKVHCEGWKTNSGWKIENKIIIPSGIRVGLFGDDWDSPWGGRDANFYDDLDEVLSRLAQVKYEPEEGFRRWVNDSKLKDVEPGKWHTRRFYDVKLHKKGTVHIRFTDLYLLDDLNAIVAKERNWLGGEGF